MSKFALVYTVCDALASVPEKGSDELRWVEVMPLGEYSLDQGLSERKMRVTAEDADMVFSALKRRKSGVPALYEHGKGPRGGMAGGWFQDWKLENGSIWLLVSWTELAAREIRSKGWKNLSPGFFGIVDKDGFIRPRAIYEVSLTNKPAIDGMAPVSAEVSDDDLIAFAAELAFDEANELASRVEVSKEEVMDFKKIAVALSLAETANEDEVVAAGAEVVATLTTTRTELETAKARVVELEAAEAARVEAAKPATFTFTAEELEAKSNARAQEIAAEMAATAEKKRQETDLCAKYEKSGAVTPATREAFLAIAAEFPVELGLLLDAKAAPVKPALTGDVKPLKTTANSDEIDQEAARYAKAHSCSIAEAKSILTSN